MCPDPTSVASSTTQHCCEEMDRHLAQGEVAIRFLPRFREYGITILDGGQALQVINHCPWCGRALPTSLRDEWFGLLETLGLEPTSRDVPIDMRTDAWWRMRGVQ